MNRFALALVAAFAAAGLGCGGEIVGGTDAGDAGASLDGPIDAPYEGECCNIYDGSTAGPCPYSDADPNIPYGFVPELDAGEFACIYRQYTHSWTHCGFTMHTETRWACIIDGDPCSCPWLSESIDGAPPQYPGLCDGYGLSPTYAGPLPSTCAEGP